MNPTYIKLGIGIALFTAWLGLIVFQVDGAADLINSIKLALAGLGVYHINDRSNP